HAPAVYGRAGDQAQARAARAARRGGRRRPAVTWTIGMCAVAGQVESRAVASGAPSPRPESSRIKSGSWHDALTIASNGVRASATRKPRPRSSPARRGSDVASGWARSTSGSARGVPAEPMVEFTADVCNSDTPAPLSPVAADAEQEAGLL